MAIKFTSLIWESERYEGNTLLTVLAMGDYADHDGVCFPSIEQLAKKSRQSERNVSYCLKRLVDDGAVTIIEAGGGSGRRTRYRINPAFFAVKCAPETLQKETPQPCNLQHGTPQSATQKPCNLQQPYKEEPSLGLSGNRQGEDPLSDPVFIAKAVQDDIGDFSDKLFTALKGQAKLELTAGKTPDAIRDLFRKAWDDYRSERDCGHLRFAHTAASFFASGLWRSRAGWDWKSGLEPKPKEESPVEKFERIEREKAERKAAARL